MFNIKSTLFTFLFVKGRTRTRVVHQVVLDSLAFETYTREGLASYFHTVREGFVYYFTKYLILKGCLQPEKLKVEYFPHIRDYDHVDYDSKGLRVTFYAYMHQGWRKYLPVPASIRMQQFRELLIFIKDLDSSWSSSSLTHLHTCPQH